MAYVGVHQPFAKHDMDDVPAILDMLSAEKLRQTGGGKMAEKGCLYQSTRLHGHVDEATIEVLHATRKAEEQIIFVQ